MVAARPMVEGSSETSDAWRTPAVLARLLGRFGIDPCSHARSHIEARVYCRPDLDNPALRDGLAVDWERFDSAFLNWPFSKPLPWALKVAQYSKPWCVLAKLDPTTRAHATLMNADGKEVDIDDMKGTNNLLTVDVKRLAADEVCSRNTAAGGNVRRENVIQGRECTARNRWRVDGDARRDRSGRDFPCRNSADLRIPDGSDVND